MKKTRGLNIAVLVFALIGFAGIFFDFVVDRETGIIISFIEYMLHQYCYALVVATISAWIIAIVTVWDIVHNILMLTKYDQLSEKYLKRSRKLTLITAILLPILQILIYFNVDLSKLLIGYSVIGISLLVRSILKLIVYAKTKPDKKAQ